MTFNRDKSQVIYSGIKKIWNHSKGRALRTESWPREEPWASQWVISKDKLKAFCIRKKKKANKLLGIFKVGYWREIRNFYLAITVTPRISASRLSSHDPKREADGDLLDEDGRSNGWINQRMGLFTWIDKDQEKQSTWMNEVVCQNNFESTEMWVLVKVHKIFINLEYKEGSTSAFNKYREEALCSFNIPSPPHPHS